MKSLFSLSLCDLDSAGHVDGLFLAEAHHPRAGVHSVTEQAVPADQRVTGAFTTLDCTSYLGHLLPTMPPTTWPECDPSRILIWVSVPGRGSCTL